MKITLLAALLALSLVANAAFYFKRGSTSAATAATGGSSPSGAAGHGEAGAKAESAQLAGLGAKLQTDDPKALVERLRAAGFSPSMIRYIVAAQINEQFSARRRAIFGDVVETPFWQARQGFMDSKTNAAMRQLGREQSAAFKEVLGPAGMIGGEEMMFYQRRQFGNLPPDKIEQLQRITSDYSELRSEVYQTSNGMMLPEDRAKLALLEKEQRADIASVLSPAEMDEYELRTSNTANQLRSQLASFKPTEAEFRALFKATQAAEAQHGGNSAMPNPGLNIRQVRNTVLEEAKSLLTPERYAELQQATDPAYQTINRLIARLDLPATVAPQVVSMQQDYMRRVSTLSRDQNLTPQQRTEQISALQQEATQKLTGVLGERGLEAYKQYGGQWLQSPQQRVTAIPAEPPRG